MPTYRKKPEAVSKLTTEQYLVALIDGTEHPFANEYLENKHPGLYIDVVSGEPWSTQKLSANASPVTSLYFCTIG